MRTIFFLLLFVAGGLSAQVSVMSYNIRYNNTFDGDNWWENRKADVAHLIGFYAPDLLGLQESLPEQTAYIAEQLPEYAYIGFGRDGEGTQSEGVPIFYRKDRYNCLANQVYWLSETPRQFSKGWDAALPRITVFGTFLDQQTQDTLYVFNCHFDHVGKIARKKSAQLLLQLIQSKGLTGKRVVVMGDLNSSPEDEPVLLLRGSLQDAFTHSQYPAYGPVGTFNGFDTASELPHRIDYIFSQQMETLRYRCIDDRRSNFLYPSDHLPVWALLK
ncbi:MAG: endonuclease/exonuclease/phosphatase family protein [Saprospiraceae bacterium]